MVGRIDTQTDQDLVLASASPRRRQLLEQLGLRLRVFAVEVDESVHAEETPGQYVARLAAMKSLAGQQQNNCQLLPVLGADTAVVIDQQILGKPQNREHALQMLMQLSGRSHQVFSAISLRGDDHWQALSISTVSFRNISRAEILAYWESGEPGDKAGAYAIQGLGALFASHVEGSFSGVMGLPIFETAELLKHAGINILRDI